MQVKVWHSDGSMRRMLDCHKKKKGYNGQIKKNSSCRGTPMTSSNKSFSHQKRRWHSVLTMSHSPHEHLFYYLQPLSAISCRPVWRNNKHDFFCKYLSNIFTYVQVEYIIMRREGDTIAITDNRSRWGKPKIIELHLRLSTRSYTLRRVWRYQTVYQNP